MCGSRALNAYPSGGSSKEVGIAMGAMTPVFAAQLMRGDNTNPVERMPAVLRNSRFFIRLM